MCVLNTEDESTRYATTATDTEQNEQETMPTTPRPLEGSGTFGTPAASSPGRSVSSCQRKSLKINIPLTNPSRTISALTDILWDELVSPSSKKCNPNGSVGKQQGVNKTKLRHAEKMIKGAFVELYKGLGYLATYR